MFESELYEVETKNIRSREVYGARESVKVWSGTLAVPPSSASVELDDTRQVWFDRRVESEGYEAWWASRPVAHGRGRDV